MVDGGGTHAPFHPPCRLLHDRAYERVRNPMYLNYVTITLAEALAYRSPALLLYALIFWGLLHFYVVAIEEPSLHRRFGNEYATYAASVPRWMPHLRTAH